MEQLPDSIISASYWVTAQLAAGQYPGSLNPDELAARIDAFRRGGVTTFVDLTHADDRMEPYLHLLGDERRLAFPIRDMDVPTLEQMTRILDAIDDAIDAGETVYVHCWGGYGRTGTVVGCWLVRHGHTYEEAIGLIEERRKALPIYKDSPLSPQTSEQHAFVRGWSRDL